MKRCETCEFYDNKVMPPDMDDKGLCRINPPTFPSHNKDQLRCGEIPRYGWGDSDWPIVDNEDWCGKWRMKEMKTCNHELALHPDDQNVYCRKCGAHEVEV